MNPHYQRLQHLLEQHEQWRSASVNLIAAENVTSPAVHACLRSDLVHRYGDYLGRDLRDRKYFGNRYLVDIEELLQSLAQKVFKAKYVETRALSGHVAGSAVIMSLTTPGARVMEVGSEGGGHRLAEKLSVTPLTPLEVAFLPFDARRYNIDLDAAIAKMHAFRPSLVIVGSSNYLFPHPVKELTDNLPEGTTLVYDASHVMGLIAGGAFQQPLQEGASLVFGSTHKTFPGPPGGIVFTNAQPLIGGVSEAIYPGLVTNHHPARSPALAVALMEMERWGPSYAQAIVDNAQSLGAQLHEQGLRVVGQEQTFTRSHTLLVATEGYGTGKEVGQCLQAAGIITNPAKLPQYWGYEGIRLGVQEVTRRGITQEGLRHLAALMATVIRREKEPEVVQAAVKDLAAGLGPVRYTLDQDEQ